jgi:patatin-like phospholipase/acyl hydrolase
VRGLSTIKILKHMMTMISNERGRQVNPWEVFDMIGGTSTGGYVDISGQRYGDMTHTLTAFLPSC